jgi:arsenite-transporting ATPase
MAPLLSPQRQLILFSGKGGVGKTTLACGLTLQLAQAAPDRHILLLSTDPAHSLGDVLALPVGSDPLTISDQPNLRVQALDAQVLLTQFKTTYGDALELIAERGSWFERDDILPVWDLTWPGVDELMAILEVNRLLAAGEADLILLDTAPTGHTLRLLDLPDFLENILSVFQTFQAKHRRLSEAFTGSYQPDAADAFLAQLEQELHQGQARLLDQEKTAMWLVMLAEHLSVAETERFCLALQQKRVPLAGIIVNQVLLSDPATASPLFLARQQQQQKMLVTLTQDLKDYSLWISPLQLQEPIGPAALQDLVHQLQPLTSFSEPATHSVPIASPLQKTNPALPPQQIPDLLQQGIRLIMTGGKGGVGKTTTAGALAWILAKRHPEQNILAVSIDPAHSLGDLFGMPLGQAPRSIQTNLWGQEIDAEVVLDQFRRDYLDEIAAIMAGDSTDIEIQYDPQAWKQLLEMPPPGLDEVMALLSVLENMAAGQADLVIVDTAPTGHMLRFLEMPEALEGWVSLALKLWLKYRDVIGRPELAQRLRSLLKQVRELRQQLSDPTFLCFIPVFNPEQAVLAETQRLLQTLDQLQIPHPYAVLNRIWLDQSDAFGQAINQRHQQLLEQLPQRLPQQTLIPIPFLADPSLDAIGRLLVASA